MNSKNKGDIGQLIVMTEALRRGYSVLQPYGDNQKYDLVFEKNGQFQRVQVKSIQPKADKLTMQVFTVVHNKEDGTKYKRVPYLSTELDLFAIVNSLTQHVFIVPHADISHLSGSKTFHKTELYEKYYGW